MPEEAHFCLCCLTKCNNIAVANKKSNHLNPISFFKSKFTFQSRKKKFAVIAIILFIIISIIAGGFYVSGKNNFSASSKPQKSVVSTVTQEDGSVIKEFDDGSVETKTADGTIITEEADGTVSTKKPDGTVVTEKTDGTTEAKKSDKTTEKTTNITETQPTMPSTSEPTSEDTTGKTTIIQYRYRDKSFTTSSNNSMNGWKLYDTTYAWSDYGSWSNWSLDSFSSSDSRQVESRTTYRYCAFKCTKCGNRDPYRTPCDNCKTSEYFEYQELWYTTKGNSMSKGTLPTVPDKYYVTINGDRWWFEKDGYLDGEGGIGQPSRKEYRYRDRKQITTYHFYKWSDWSEWSTIPVSSSDTREVETRNVN